MRVRAVLDIQGYATLVRTNDLSVQGMSIILPFTLKDGVSVQIQFSISLDGKLQEITVAAKSTNCTLSADEFRTGFVFTSLTQQQKSKLAHIAMNVETP